MDWQTWMCCQKKPRAKFLEEYLNDNQVIEKTSAGFVPHCRHSVSSGCACGRWRHHLFAQRGYQHHQEWDWNRLEWNPVYPEHGAGTAATGTLASAGHQPNQGFRVAGAGAVH